MGAEQSPKPISREHLRAPPAFRGMTIGLLGGTFDPPHGGHLHISEVALKRLGLDALWWLVTPGNPLKTRDDMAAFNQRFAQARAQTNDPRIEVTGFEAPLGSAYTAETLSYITQRYPETRFIWVMGADNLVNFHRWERWRDILQMVPVAVVDRPGYRFAALSGRAALAFAQAYVDESDARGLGRFVPPAWTFITARLSALSSTELRAMRRNQR